MLSGVNATYSSFFFISLKPWKERKTPDTSYEAIKKHLQQNLAKVPSGLAFSFPPPAIPGVGTSGGVTFILQDRSGKGLELLEKNTKVFLAEARKRSRSNSASSTKRYRRSWAVR
jgi:HAE1 family hydrophobic/amphiphilic exporter-1